MAKDKLKQSLVAGAVVTALASSGFGVYADENTTPTTTPNDGTTDSSQASTEATTPTNIETVEGVTVQDGVAIVSETPTADTVNQAKDIKDDADQAVSNQEAVVDKATQAEADAQAAKDKASQEVKDAEAIKEQATDENIAATEQKITDTTQAITDKQTEADTAAQKTAEAEQKAADQEDVVNEDKKALAGQQTVVDNAQKAVDTAQANLDGSSAGQVLKEQTDATKALADAKQAEQNASTALDTAKENDANKATQISDLKAQQTAQQATADTTAAELADATTAATKAAQDKATADQLVQKLTDELNNANTITPILLNPDVISAYKTYVNDKTQENKDALNAAIKKGVQLNRTSMVYPDDNTTVNPLELTTEQTTALSQYYAYLVNNLREQVWDVNGGLFVSDLSVEAIQNITKAYTDAEKPWSSGHNINALNNDGVDNFEYTSEVISSTTLRSNTMSELYQEVAGSVLAFMILDYSQNYGHMITMLNSNATSVSRDVSVGAGWSITSDARLTGRVHFVTFDGTATETPITSPYDTTQLQADLAAAKATQATATQANTSAQTRLASATAANNAAQSDLATTTAQINALTSKADETPAAQTAYDKAVANVASAQTRLDAANAAVANLDADIQTKRQLLADAQAVLQAEQDTLADLVTQKATDQATLDTLRANVAALKADEAKIASEIKALETTLAETKVYLDKLQNADANLAEAQAKFVEAEKNHTAALATLSAEQAVLAQLRLDQKDANAQYEAVLAAYQKAQIKDQYDAIVNAGGTPIAITDDAGNITGYIDGNQTAGTQFEPVTYSRVARAKALPQTGSQESLALLALGALAASLGLTAKRSRKRQW